MVSSVFDNTVATFYWLLSLLAMYVKEQRMEILAIDIVSCVLAYVWRPIKNYTD